VNTALILAEEIDPNGVTPGVVGFAITAAVAITAMFLILDMNRRIRRLRYRDEAAANIDAEVAVDSLIDDVNKETGNK
jgi:lactate dehydrogenase-like 2-hydroxyacid dehydrogenase